MKWTRFSGEVLTGDLLDELENIFKKSQESGEKLRVCIGTDSQVTAGETEFATVIVFVREKRGGFMLINKDKTTRNYTLRERMIEEVGKSIMVAYQVCPILDKYGIDLEVHADINTNPQFKSNSALSEAMGYILSMGYVFKAKPDAFASSACANKVVH